MRKLHDIDKLARDGTHQPPTFTPGSARWEAIEARLQQGTDRRKSPAAWWIWALTGALVLTGGFTLWFATQGGSPAEQLQAQRAVERATETSLQSMPLRKSVTSGGGASTSISATEAGQGALRNHESELENPGTSNTTVSSNTDREPSIGQNIVAQHTRETRIAEAEPQHTDAGHVSGSTTQEGERDEDSSTEENQADQQDAASNEVEVSGFDGREPATSGASELASERETTDSAPEDVIATVGGATLHSADATESRLVIDLDLLQQYPYINSLVFPAIPDQDFRQHLARYKGNVPRWTLYLDFGNRILPSWTTGSLLLMNPHVGAGIGYRPGTHFQFSAGLRSYIRHGENLTHSVDHIDYSFGRITERYTQHLQSLLYLEMPLGIEYLAGSRIWIGAGLNPALLLTTRSEIAYSLPGQAGETPVNEEPGRHYMDGLKRFDVAADARIAYRFTELTDLYLRAHIGMIQVPDGTYFEHPGSGRSHGIVIGLKHHLK